MPKQLSPPHTSILIGLFLRPNNKYDDLMSQIKQGFFLRRGLNRSFLWSEKSTSPSHPFGLKHKPDQRYWLGSADLYIGQIPLLCRYYPENSTSNPKSQQISR